MLYKLGTLPAICYLPIAALFFVNLVMQFLLVFWGGYMCLSEQVAVKSSNLQGCLDYAAMCKRHYHALAVIAGRGKIKPVSLADKKPDTLKIERLGTPLQRALAAEKRAKKK